MGDKGLAIIQQRYDLDTKHTWLDEIAPWLTDILYLLPKKGYLDSREIQGILWRIKYF